MIEWLIIGGSVIGWGVTAAVLMYLFSSVGKYARSMNVHSSTPSVSASTFLLNTAIATGAKISNFDVEGCQIFTNNEKWYEALIEDVRTASLSIYISTYIWENDQVSRKFFDALKNAAGRGVQVRLLLDDFGNSLKEDQIKTLQESGILVKKFRPLKFGKISIYFSRNHRRSYIFDNSIAYIGGSSVSQKWFTIKNRRSFTYKDVMYRFSGNMVLHSLVAFGEIWTAVSGEIIQIPPIHQLAEKDLPKNSLHLNHAPRLDIHPLTYMLWYSCLVAKKSITICSPYIIPGEALSEILISKARCGVAVTFLTQGTREIWFVTTASQSYYEAFLQAGVTIKEYQGPEHLHTKIMVVDDVWTVIGSANFDIRSQRINHESVIGVQSEMFATLNNEVVESYQANSKTIVLSEWQHRPLVQKLAEKVTKQFSEQM